MTLEDHTRMSTSNIRSMPHQPIKQELSDSVSLIRGASSAPPLIIPYLAAMVLERCPNISIIPWSRDVWSRDVWMVCGRSRDVWMVPKEKMTDVLAPYEEEVHKFTQTRVNVNLPWWVVGVRQITSSEFNYSPPDHAILLISGYHIILSNLP